MELSNVIQIDNRIYDRWVRFLNPIYNLTETEILVTAALIEEYMRIQDKVSDEELLNQLLFGLGTRKKIKEKINMKDNYFDVILNKLRKRNIIVDGKINNQIIPKRIKNSKDISLLIYFKSDED